MSGIKHFTAEDIAQMEKVFRLNLMNSTPGFKSANLIGTQDTHGHTNLAIFSSVIHMGSNPALLGCIMRPDTVARHTLDNIRESGFYTINHIHTGIAEQAHYTSASFDESVSEFEACHFQAEYREGFSAPFVAESRLKMAMQLVDEIPIEANGTFLLIGKVEHLFLEEDALSEDGQLDLNELQTVAISGLNRYHKAEEIGKYPYARVEEVPDFNTAKKKRPDNVVFNEKTQKYDASLMPYATNIGGPAFVANDLSLWKNDSASKISHHFKQRFHEIRDQYDKMIDQIQWNEIVYNSKFNFEPVVGEVYHLYQGKDEKPFLSLVDPGSWDKQHLGSFQLTTDRMWECLEMEVEETQE